MRQLLLLLTVLTFVGFDTVKGLSDKDRNLALNELTETETALLQAVKGLSEEQLNFKPTPDAWSIANCVEHIAISEHLLFNLLNKALESPADPSKRQEVSMTDEAIMKVMESREQKVKTGKPMEPTSQYGTFKGSLKEFKSQRKEHIHYVKKTDDDLRNHYTQMQLGTIDGVQILLVISSHTERHVKQIEEIKQAANFPK